MLYAQVPMIDPANDNWRRRRPTVRKPSRNAARLLRTFRCGELPETQHGIGEAARAEHRRWLVLLKTRMEDSGPHVRLVRVSSKPSPKEGRCRSRTSFRLKRRTKSRATATDTASS